MKAEAIEPDIPPRAMPAHPDASAFGAALGEAAQALERADAAETDFAQQRGGLAEAVLERAKADVMLQIATTAASRTTQALAAILNMQV